MVPALRNGLCVLLLTYVHFLSSSSSCYALKSIHDAVPSSSSTDGNVGLADVVDRMGAMERKIENLEHFNTDLRTENKAMTGVIQQMTQTIERLSQYNKDVVDSIHALTNDTKDMRKTIEELAIDNQVMMETNVALTKDNKNMRKIIEELAIDNQFMMETNVVLAKDNKEMRNTIDELAIDNQLMMETSVALTKDNKDRAESIERFAKDTEILMTNLELLTKDTLDMKSSMSDLGATNGRLQLELGALNTRFSKLELANEKCVNEHNKSLERIVNDQKNGKSEDTSDSVANGDSGIGIVTHGAQSTDNQSTSSNSRGVRQSMGGSYVAFTAYLSHELDGAAAHDVIVYDQVLLNEGDGYSDETGRFTVPVSGIYLFSMSVAARKLSDGDGDGYDSLVRLFVNDVVMVGATAESHAYADDNQGSCTIILRVASGDEVWTSNSQSNPVNGDDTRRATSFSGVLLFVDEQYSATV